MKIRNMSLRQAEAALAKARKHCPGSRHERHLERRIEALKARSKRA